MMEPLLDQLKSEVDWNRIQYNLDRLWKQEFKSQDMPNMETTAVEKQWHETQEKPPYTCESSYQH